MFKTESSQSSKHCGKSAYMSPEVVSNKTGFDAKKNDVWSFGICLFMLCLGDHPWAIANESDQDFVLVMKHSIFHLLKQWKRLNHVNGTIICLFDLIFRSEASRSSIAQIKQYID